MVNRVPWNSGKMQLNANVPLRSKGTGHARNMQSFVLESRISGVELETGWTAAVKNLWCGTIGDVAYSPFPRHLRQDFFFPWANNILHT